MQLQSQNVRYDGFPFSGVVRELVLVPPVADERYLELISPDERDHVLPSGATPQHGVPSAVQDHLGEHLWAGHEVEQSAGEHDVLVRDHLTSALPGLGQRHIGPPLFAVRPGEHQQGPGQPDRLPGAAGPLLPGRRCDRRLGQHGEDGAYVVHVTGRVVPQANRRVREHVHVVRLVRPPGAL